MSKSIYIKKHVFKFKFEAATSRSVLKEKVSYFIIIEDADKNNRGIGEAGVLAGLSFDDIPDYETTLQQLIKRLPLAELPNTIEEVQAFVYRYIPESFPSIRFGLETALLDFINGGIRKIYDTDFFKGKQKLPINGLIWMGDADFMQQQIEEKLAQGFNCIKMKIGAIAFEQELKLLKQLRDSYSKEQLILRVDANGAFDRREAPFLLEKLATLDIHSIEQPIKAGQWPAMRELCEQAILPIALDEELIGVPDNQMEELLDLIQPPYIILKPNLHGGLYASEKWIGESEKRNIKWWMTSALESNIGLNAIAQFTSQYKPKMHQGLGTGQLYHNNIESPLSIENGTIFYDTQIEWGL